MTDPTPTPEQPRINNYHWRSCDFVPGGDLGCTCGLFAAIEAEAQARPEQDEAVQQAAEAIEQVLTGMDWLGTGSSQEAADNDEREAWRHWGTILSVLGDHRDPYERVYTTGGDIALATPPPATPEPPRCLRCGATWVHRDDYAGLGTPHRFEQDEAVREADAGRRQIYAAVDAARLPDRPEQPRTSAGRQLLATLQDELIDERGLLRRRILAIEAEAQARPEQDEAVRLLDKIEETFTPHGPKGECANPELCAALTGLRAALPEPGVIDATPEASDADA